MGSDVSIGLVLRYSSKRGAGVDICVVCFVESIVQYLSFIMRYSCSHVVVVVLYVHPVNVYA
jgi:hypothetical protein